MHEDIISKWVDEASLLETGDKLFIPCESREQRKELAKQFNAYLSNLSYIDPIKSSRLRIDTTTKDKKLWVVLEKVESTPLVGFIKSKGQVIRVEIDDPEKERRRKLMREDGYTEEEIQEREG